MVKYKYPKELIKKHPRIPAWKLVARGLITYTKAGDPRYTKKGLQYIRRKKPVKKRRISRPRRPAWL